MRADEFLRDIEDMRNGVERMATIPQILKRRYELDYKNGYTQEKKILRIRNELEEAQNEYEELLKEQKEEDKRKLFAAYEKSKRDLDEIIDFMKGKSPIFSGNVLGGAAKLAFHMANAEIIEKQGINILSSGKIKSRLVPVISESFQKAGLMLEIRDLELHEDTSARLAGKTHEKKHILPDHIEEPIIEALAAFLKCTVQ